MTLTNAHAGIALATSVLLLIGSFVEHTLVQERRFAALDTRLGKLESAVKVLNASTIDERYKQAIKELMAEAQQASPDALKKAEVAQLPTVHCPKGYDTEYTNFADPTRPLIGGCISHNLNHPEERQAYPADAGAAADMPAVKVPK